MIAWDGEETRFLKVITIFFNIEEMDSVLSLSHQWAWRNRKLKRIKTDGIDYPLMRFQFWNMFEDPELGLKGSSLWVYLVVVNQGCCRSSQYILLDSMLWLDANTTLNQIYVLFITFVSMTYQSGDQYLPSIHSWDIGPWYVLYIPFFFFRSLFLTNFLLKSRVLSIVFITSSFILIIIPSVIKMLIMIIITISNIVFRFTVIFRTSIVCCVFFILSWFNS